MSRGEAEHAWPRLLATFSGLASVTAVLLLIPVYVSAESIGESWLPLRCKAFNTVGLHDFNEEDEAQIEEYSPQVFVPSIFDIRENHTFNALLPDRETKFYVTVSAVGSDDGQELTCVPVKGLDSQRGFSCQNTPPTEVLTIVPDTKRFTRSSAGGWTFYSAGDTSEGASLFIENGICAPLPETEELEEEESTEPSDQQED